MKLMRVLLFLLCISKLFIEITENFEHFSCCREWYSTTWFFVRSGRSTHHYPFSPLILSASFIPAPWGPQARGKMVFVLHPPFPGTVNSSTLSLVPSNYFLNPLFPPESPVFPLLLPNSFLCSSTRDSDSLFICSVCFVCLKFFANLINPPSTPWCGSYYLPILQIRRKGPERASKLLEVTLINSSGVLTLFNFYWYIVGLQCCVNFRCVQARWLSSEESTCCAGDHYSSPGSEDP